MADKKISDLNAITGANTADDDLFVIVDSSANETKKITRAEMIDAVTTGLIDGAPAALDTLNELAAALGDDANFSTTVTNNIATKVSKSGDSMTGNLSFGDNDKAQFGDGNDLQIFHDGSNSYVADAGTGGLYLKGSNEIALRSASNENIFLGLTDGAAYVYHNGSAKLATTSTGVDVTGTVTADGLTVDGATDPTIRLHNTGSVGSGELLGTVEFYQEDGSSPGAGVVASVEARNTDAAAGAGSLAFTTGYSDSNNDRMLINSNGDISFYDSAGTSQAFHWDAADERLGIGTTSPSQALHVVAPSNEQLRLDGTDAVDTTIIMDYNGGGATNRVRLLNKAGDFAVNVNNTSEAMRIDSDGNVGIGTDDPQTHLEVEADSGAQSGTVDNPVTIRLTDTASSQSNTTDTTNPYAKLEFYSRDTSNEGPIAQAYIGAVYDDIYSAGSELSFATWNQGNSSATEAMRIDSSGNVGIGTTSPAGKLHASNTSGYLRTYLTASTSSYADINFGDSSDNDIGRLIYHNSDNSMQFVTNASEAMRIDSSGNVLVGKTSQTIDTVGVELLGSLGKIHATRSGAASAGFNRTTSDGDIAVFYKNGTTVGSIGTLNSSLFIGNGDSFLRFIGSEDRVQPSTASGTNRDAAITLGKDSSRFKDLYLSGGVYLGGTGSANHLDDYEEGFWTPAFDFGISITGASGHYTKIGRQVIVKMQFTVSNSTSSAHAIITNLPFTSSGSDLGGGFRRYSTDSADRYFHVNSSNTTISLYNGNGTTTPVSSCANKRYDIVAFYFTS